MLLIVFNDYMSDVKRLYFLCQQAILRFCIKVGQILISLIVTVPLSLLLMPQSDYTTSCPWCSGVSLSDFVPRLREWTTQTTRHVALWAVVFVISDTRVA